MFSIVMPYYKNIHVVGRAINSVLRQTIPDFELIIIDDGSNDSVDEYIKQFNAGSIRVIHQKNQGVSKARNVGIANASGDWVCFLDSDDYWEPNHLEVLSEMIKEHENLSVFITSYYRLGNQKRLSSRNVPKAFPVTFVSNNFLKMINSFGQLIHTNSVCVRRALLKRYGAFNESLKLGEDIDLWYRLCLNEKVCFSKTATTNYLKDASVLTKNTYFPYSWPFAYSFIDFGSDSLPIENYNAYKEIAVKHFVSEAKHYLIDGNKKKASSVFRVAKEIDADFAIVKRMTRFVMLVCLCLPSFVVSSVGKFLYERRVRNN